MSSLVNQIRETYDTVRYLGGAFPESHPLNLNRTSTLLGLSPAPIVRCRVLEIGCAEGLNLLPIAENFPFSQFLGLDLSSKNIDVAKETQQLLGLTNIEFRCGDIAEFDCAAESYDYIIAHGFYSWVPSDVRDRLMQVMRKALAPQGVGYISYNTLPGWHLKNISRDLMLFHSRSAKTSAERLKKGLEILPFVSQNLPSTLGYREVMRAAAESIPKSPNILHDEMGVVNDAVYFEQFVKHAEQFQLKYLGHASLSSGMPSLPIEIQRQIMMLSSDEVSREQYVDFLGGRAFRVSLVCRDDATISAQRGNHLIPKMHVAAWLKEDVSTSARSDSWQFINQKDKRPFGVHDSRMRKVLQKISAAWPQSISVAELIATNSTAVEETASDAPFVPTLCEMLYNMFVVDLVELHTIPIDFIGSVSDRFSTTALARLQAKSDMSITNLRHEGIPHNNLLGRIIPLLDGTKTRTQLLQKIGEMVDLRDISIASRTEATPDENIQSALRELLHYLSDNSLLLS